jgi:hypothetical protein
MNADRPASMRSARRGEEEEVGTARHGEVVDPAGYGLDARGCTQIEALG